MEGVMPGLQTSLVNEVCMKHLMLARLHSGDSSRFTVDAADVIDGEKLKVFAMEYSEDLLTNLFKFMLDPKTFKLSYDIPTKPGPLEIKPKTKRTDHFSDEDPVEPASAVSQYAVALTKAQILGAKRLLNYKPRGNVPKLTTRRTVHYSMSETRRILYIQNDLIRMTHGPKTPRPSKPKQSEAFPDNPYINSEYFANLMQNSRLSGDSRTKKVLEQVLILGNKATYEAVSKQRTLLSISENPSAHPTAATLMIKDTAKLTEGAGKNRRGHSKSRIKLKLNLDSFMQESSEEDEAVVLKNIDKRGKCCVSCTVF